MQNASDVSARARQHVGVAGEGFSEGKCVQEAIERKEKDDDADSLKDGDELAVGVEGDSRD